MLLSEPPPSQGDLHFRIYGFPVRVHPMFWLVTAIMGFQSGEEGGTPPGELLSWVAVVFVSILIHELGHAVLQRRYGGHPWITLYGLGGLASCDDCDRSPRSQIIISLAGPLAGFLLAGAVVLLMGLSGHPIAFEWGERALGAMTLTDPKGFALFRLWVYWESLASPLANDVVFDALWINVMWGAINLLPIYPLDGGRVAREVFTLQHPRRGIVQSLQISAIVAIAMAIVGALAWKSLFTALMFGYLAYSNYQTLQAYRDDRW